MSTEYRPQPPRDLDDLRTEIAETRAGLGDTMDALTAKLDVKSRAGAAVRDARASAKQRAATGVRVLGDMPAATAVAVLGGAVALAAFAVGVARMLRGKGRSR